MCMSKELSDLERVLKPAESVLKGLSLKRNPKTDMSEKSLFYIKDTIDHVQVLVETVDTLEEDAKRLLDFVFNTISFSSNEIMKGLALLSMVFMPITFLAGVYGYYLINPINGFDLKNRMNFEYFPEIKLDYGIWHFWVLTSIVLIVTFLLSLKLGWTG